MDCSTGLILNVSVCDKDVNVTEVLNILPPWKTYMLEGKIIDKESFPQLNLKFLLDVHDQEDFQKWRIQLQDINKTVYSIHGTEKSMGKYVNFKQRLVCQHNTRSQNVYEPSVRKRTSTKNTNCPSKITVALHAIKKRYQGKNKEKYALLREMPCEVTFIATHNHSTLSADSLRFRKLSDELKSRLLDLYHNGHSPASALKQIKIELQLIDHNYADMLADRKYCPTYHDCYHLYRKEFFPSHSHETDEIATEDGREGYNGNLGDIVESKSENDQEEFRMKAKEISSDIFKLFNTFINKSPIEAAKGMEIMRNTVQKIRHPSTFASCCINFGSGIRRKNRGVQPTPISQGKTNLVSKRCHVGGPPKNAINNESIKKKLLQGIIHPLK